jgi:hypothetical protein
MREKPVKKSAAEQARALNAAVDAMKDEWFTCRAFGHNWKPTTAVRDASWGILLTLSCQTCKTRREDTIDRIGQVSARSYTHPDGYLLGGYDVRPGRADWRLKVVNRMVKAVDRVEEKGRS